MISIPFMAPFYSVSRHFGRYYLDKKGMYLDSITYIDQ